MRSCRARSRPPRRRTTSYLAGRRACFHAWQQTQGPADLPDVADERLAFRLLPDPAEPTPLRNVLSPDRTFTFTGGKAASRDVAPGPGRSPGQGSHRRPRRSGRRRVRRAFLVRRLGPGHRHRRRRAAGADGHRQRLPRLGPLDEGQPRRSPDHQLLEPGCDAGPGGARREVGRVAPPLRDLRRLAQGQGRQGLLRRRGPVRLRGSGFAPRVDPHQDSAAAQPAQHRRGGERCRRLRRPLLQERIDRPGGTGAGPPRRARSGARGEAERAHPGTAEAAAGLLPRLRGCRGEAAARRA